MIPNDLEYEIKQSNPSSVVQWWTNLRMVHTQFRNEIERKTDNNLSNVMQFCCDG